MPDYVIRYRLDDTQAQQAFERAISNAKAAEAAWAGVGTSMTNSGRAGAQAAAQSVQGFKSMGAAAAVTFKQTTSGFQGMGAAAGVTFKQTTAGFQGMGAAASVTFKQVESGFRGIGSAAAVTFKHVATDAQSAFRGIGSAAAVTFKQVQNGFQGMGAAAGVTFKQTTAGFQGIGSAAAAAFKPIIQDHNDWLARVVKIHLAYMAMRAVRTVFQEIGQAMKDMSAESNKAGQAMLDKLQQVRALASVMGIIPNRQFAAEQAQFDIETGLPGGKGQQFRETFRGRAQALRGQTISESEFDVFEKQAAKLISAKGLEPGLGGDVAGAVLKAEDFKKAGKGSKEAMARLVNSLAIMDAFSGTLKQLAPEFTAIVATLVDETGGVLRNVEEAAVALAVEAEFKPGEGEVFTRRGFAGLRDFKNKKKARFFQVSKIGPETTGLAHFQLAAAAIQQEMADRKVPVDVAIQNLGFTEQREQIALKAMFNAREKVLAKAIPMMGKVGPAGAQDVLAKLTTGATGEAFMAEQARARVEGGEVIGGRRKTALEIAKLNAKAEIEEEARSAPWTMQMRQIGAWFRGGFATESGTGREKLIEERAMGRLRQQAGVPQAQRIPGMLAPALFPAMQRAKEGPATEAERLNEMINKQLKEQQDQTMLLKAMVALMGGKAPPGAPNPKVGANVQPNAGAVRP